MENKFYFIKPIKIRFVSGGTECSTLEQLRRVFSPHDVIASFSQLNKWLGQIGEGEVKTELNKIIKEFKFVDDNIILVNTPSSFYSLYKVFFKKSFTDDKIFDLIELFIKWHNKQYLKSNYQYLYETISKQSWGEQILYYVAERAIHKNRGSFHSEDLLFKEYQKFLDKNLENNNIHCLSDLFLHFGKDSSSRSHFESLNKTVRYYNWSAPFFLNLIPQLFETHEEKVCLVQLENSSFSLSNEDSVLSIYDYFLDNICHEKGISDLSELYLIFLREKQFKKNFIVLQKIISEAEWGLDFVCNHELIPKIIQTINQVPRASLNDSFSTKDEKELFQLYSSLIDSYLKKRSITSLTELYLTWDRHHNSEQYFVQLHNEIQKLPWGNEFMNRIFYSIFKKWSDNHGKRSEESSEASYIMDEESLIGFYTRYFSKHIDKGSKIPVLISLYTKWSHDKEHNLKYCFLYLSKALKNNLWGVSLMLRLYESDRVSYKEKTKEEWFLRLIELSQCKTDEVSHLVQIGKYLIEDYRSFEKGLELLEKAESQGVSGVHDYKEMIRVKESLVSDAFISLYQKLDEDKWNCDTDFFKQDDILVSKASSLKEQWILRAQITIHYIYNNAYDMIDKFVDSMRILGKLKERGYGLEPPYVFYNIFERTDWKRVCKERMNAVAEYKGDSFIEIRFVFALICITNSKYSENGWMIMKSLNDLYIPARYLLNEEVHNPILDKLKFRLLVKENVREALKEYCKVMVLF